MVSKKIKPSIQELAPLIIQSLGDGKKVKLTVTGVSMYPLFKADTDSVIIEKTDSPKKYDVVLYCRDDGTYVLHRVLSERNGDFVFAGDNERIKEYGVKKSSCIAKMTAFERRGVLCNTDALWYLIYSRMWVWFFSFRRPLSKMLHLVSALFRFLGARI